MEYNCGVHFIKVVHQILKAPDKAEKYFIFSTVVNRLMQSSIDPRDFTNCLVSLLSIVNEKPIDLYHSKKECSLLEKRLLIEDLKEDFTKEELSRYFKKN